MKAFYIHGHSGNKTFTMRQGGKVIDNLITNAILKDCSFVINEKKRIQAITGTKKVQHSDIKFYDFQSLKSTSKYFDEKVYAHIEILYIPKVGYYFEKESKKKVENENIILLSGGNKMYRLIKIG